MFCAVLVVASVLVAGPPSAAALPAPPVPTAGAAPPGMALEDALRTAFAKRPDLLAAHARVEARKRAATASTSIFIPRLLPRIFGENSRAAIAGPFDGFFQRDDTITSESLGLGVALTDDLPTGTSIELGADGSVGSFTYYAEALNPRWAPELHLKLTQHLWRGFGLDVNLAPVAVADAVASVEEATAAAREQAAALDVTDAWLDASRAAAVVGLRQKSVELANQFEALTRQLIEGGSLSRLDLALALQTVASRKADLAGAEADRDLAVSRLGEALGMSPSGDDATASTSSVFNAGPLVDVAGEAPALGVVVSSATAASPELRAAKAAQKRVQADAPQRSDWWKPDIRLVVDGSVAGLAGTSTCVSGFLRDGITPCHVPDAFVGGPDTAVKNLAAGKLYGLSVAIEGDMPVFFGPGLASADSATADLHAADADVAAADEHVQWQARRLLHDLAERTRILASADENLKLAAQALEAEDTKMRSGRSTGFDLLRAQDLRVGAELQETDARYQLAGARARLQALMGALTPEDVSKPLASTPTKPSPSTPR